MQNFSPFPLRARGAFEIFDAAIKLYKQYFWILLGWSAIDTGASMFGSMVTVGGIIGLFLTPLSIGAVVCCVAAAVRGQSVQFGQCWQFTQPRYWMMLGMYVVATILALLIAGVFVAVCTGIGFAGFFAFQNSPLTVQIVMGILAFLIFGIITTITWTVFFSWIHLVPIVVCMEEDKRGTAALGRAFEILRGHWVRITALMAMVGLGGLALFAILAGAAALIVGVGQIGDLLKGDGSGTTALWLGVAAMGLVFTAITIVYMPLYYLILTVFYLDVRVRQEALDLEWTAHASMPAQDGAPGVAATPVFIPTGMATSYPATGYSASELSPSSFSPQPTTQSLLQPSADAPQPSSLYGTRPLNEEPNPFSPAALELEPIAPAESPFATSTGPSFTPPQSAPETPGEPEPNNLQDRPIDPTRPPSAPPTAW